MDRVKRKMPWFKEQIFSNAAYKLIAFLVTLVLWLSFVGRKETVSRSIDVQYLVSQEHVITNNIQSQVRVKVEGPRIALAKFSQKEAVFKVRMKDFKLGWNKINLKQSGLELPVGVKFVSVTPKVIRARIQKIE